MSDPKDFLAECAVAAGANPRLDRIRDRSAEVVLAVYRLLKNALVHAIDNDAVQETARTSAEVLGSFAAEVGSAATLTFVDDSVFVCGQLLRASLQVFHSAPEPALLLGPASVSECAFDAAIGQRDLVELARAFATSVRDGGQKGYLLGARLANVVVRKADGQVARRQHDDDLSPSERVVQLYATALVAMRAFYEETAEGVTLLPHKVKRLAQRLVMLAEAEDPALLGMTAMARAHRDDAGRAVQTAILALAIGRQITSERVALSQLVMGALMADAGRARVAGAHRADLLAPLSDGEEARVPGASALVGLTTGGVNPWSAARCCAVVEAAWSERAALIGPPWSGALGVTLMGQILCLARELLDAVAPRDTRRALSPADALAQVLASSTADRTLLRVLVRAVGLLPVGTVVELEGGEWAVVVASSERQALQPVLRVVTDKKGAALEAPTTLDLGQHGVTVRIARVIEPERARFNVTRAFVAGTQ